MYLASTAGTPLIDIILVLSAVGWLVVLLYRRLIKLFVTPKSPQLFTTKSQRKSVIQHCRVKKNVHAYSTTFIVKSPENGIANPVCRLPSFGQRWLK